MARDGDSSPTPNIAWTSEANLPREIVARFSVVASPIAAGSTRCSRAMTSFIAS